MPLRYLKNPQTDNMGTEKTSISLLVGNPTAGHQPVTLGYVNVFTPKENLSGKLKYSTRITIPKSDKKLVATIQQAITELTATATRLSGNKLPPKFEVNFRDGDTDNEKNDESLEGCYYLSASSDGEKKAPGCVKRENGMLLPATDDDIFSGCKAIVDISIFLYGIPDASKCGGKRGISFGLNNIMKAPGGERIGGARSAESAFGGIEIGEDESYL